MTFKMKNMKYWKSKNGLPGINNNSEGNTDLPDGRSGSSPFQEHTQEHEGNETMGGEQLSELTGKNYPGETDYYINRDENNKPVVLGEVGLEEGEVIGVPGIAGGKLTRKSDKPK